MGIFFVFAKGLRAQRAGRVAPRRGGAERRAAALGAAQRREAPPQAAESGERPTKCVFLLLIFRLYYLGKKKNVDWHNVPEFGQICGQDNL